MPVIFWDASLYAIVEALSSIAIALIIWYGGGQIVKGALTFGVLVAFIQYIEKFFTPVRDLSAKYSVMQGAMAALERIFALLDTPADEAPIRHTGRQPAGTIAPSPGVGSFRPPLIEFRQVSFAYRESENALEELDLVIRRGERVALVGESGGGKTTITRLLTRLYEIDSGCILLEGTDIRSIPLNDLRRRIGIVLQDPCLFSGSIEFNICLGDQRARERVRMAAEVVGAAAFIERLPGGYAEEVLERGNNLSTGEKQLISFARAVAFDPEVLVLDEATASVDSAAEQMIQQGISALMRGRTSLVVAHRLSTIQDADRIVVIHRARKKEEGTHGELMEREGLYYRLHQLQFS
jgi:ATP-binding cassette subfamily B protein